MQGTLQRSTRLKEFLGSIEAKRHSPLATPDEAERTIQEVKAITSSFQEFLSVAQIKVSAQAVASLEHDVQVKVQSAIRWLDDCERRASEGQGLDEVARLLARVPAFLPEDQNTRLHALAESVKQHAESKQVESATLTTLRAVSTKGSLSDLRKHLGVVNGLPVSTDIVREEIEGKVRAIQQEVSRLEEFENGLAERLDATTDLRKVEHLQSEILRHQSLFEGSEAAEVVQNALGRCAQLKQFFECIDSKRHAPITTPEEARDRIEQLKAITANCRSTLSPAQVELGGEAVASVETELESKADSAAAWLEACERLASEAKGLDELLTKIAAVPAFLPEILKARLQALTELLKQHSDTKQAEASALSTLRAISAKGGLAELRKQLSVVESLGVSTDAVGEQAQQKIVALHEEMSRLGSLEKKISERLNAATDLRSLEQVRSDILRHQTLFDESDAADRVQSELDRSTRLKKFFESLDAVSRGPIGTPDEGLGRIQEINAISANFRDSLTAAQIAAAARALGVVEEEIEKKAKAAIEWLEARENDLTDSVDPEVLAHQLERDPVFLPVRLRLRLLQVIEKNNQRIDDDQILSVVVHFKKIADTEKRQRCLQQLKILMDESSAECPEK